MDRIGRIAAGVVLAAFALSFVGCTRAPEVSSARAQVERPAVELFAFDPIPVLEAGNTYGSVTPTSAPSEVTEQDAVTAASQSWRSLESSPTFITSRKVVYSGPDVKNRTAWLVGAAPVVVRTHGLNPGTRSGRGVYVVDATTGQILAMHFGSLPTDK